MVIEGDICTVKEILAAVIALVSHTTPRQRVRPGAGLVLGCTAGMGLLLDVGSPANGWRG